MRAAIRIELNEPDVELVHRFQNFGEDVYRALRDRCSISIDEIDRAPHTFEVRDIPRRDSAWSWTRSSARSAGTASKAP